MAETVDPIVALYQSIGQTPDAGGLAYWQGQLANGMPLSDVTKNFYTAVSGFAGTSGYESQVQKAQQILAGQTTNPPAATTTQTPPPAMTLPSAVSYSGPVYNNNAWGTRAQSPFSYVTPWQTQENGVQLPDGSVWFRNPTNTRIGTADVNYGFAASPDQIIDPYSNTASTSKAGQTAVDFVKNYVKQGVEYNGQQGFTVPADKVQYLDAGNGIFVQTGRDNGKYAPKAKSGLGGVIGTVLSAVSAFVPGMQWLAPYAAAYNVVDGVAEGNLGQALGGFLGTPMGQSVMGPMSTALQTQMGISAQTANAIVAAAAGATTAKLSGGDAVIAAMIAGGLQYASPTVQAELAKMGIDSQEKLTSVAQSATITEDGSFTGPATGADAPSNNVATVGKVVFPTVTQTSPGVFTINSTGTGTHPGSLPVNGSSTSSPDPSGFSTSPGDWKLNGDGTMTNTSTGQIYNPTTQIVTAPNGTAVSLNTGAAGTQNQVPGSGTGGGGTSGGGSTTPAGGGTTTTTGGGGVSPVIGGGGSIIPAVIGAVAGVAGSGSTTTTSEKTPWSTAVPYLQNVLNMENSKLGGYVPFTPDQLVAGLNGTQTAANTDGLQTAQSQAAYADEIAAALKPYATGGMLDPEKNPYAKAALDATLRQITQKYQTSVMPSITSNAVQTGGVGGSRQGVAQSLASRDYLQMVADTSAKVNNDLYTQNFSQMMQAQNQLPNVFTWQQQPFTIGQQVGTQEQSVEQAKKDAAWKIWQAQQTQQQNAANTISQIGGQGSATVQEFPGQNPLVAGIAGAVAGSQLGKVLS